jgi:predicted ATPase
MLGHRLMANALAFTGDIADSRAHYDRAIALYDPAEHRPLATRFGVELGTVNLCFRAQARWLLGYPDAALADAEYAMTDARDIGQAGTLMYVLSHSAVINMLCGNYAASTTRFKELCALTDEKGTNVWKAQGLMTQGCVSALTGKASDAVQMISTGISAFRKTTSTLFTPLWSSYLARAHAEAGQFDDAWRSIGETMTVVETTGEVWWEADIHRLAGEIALMSAAPDAAKAQAYFERALAVARAQQAKSLELRAAMSMARLLRDQGKHDAARALLAPVYGWFSEGFDTLDLKEAKALLDELQARQPISKRPVRTRRETSRHQ